MYVGTSLLSIHNVDQHIVWPLGIIWKLTSYIDFIFVEISIIGSTIQFYEELNDHKNKYGVW